MEGSEVLFVSHRINSIVSLYEKAAVRLDICIASS